MKNALYKNSICHFIKEKINSSLIQIFYNIFFNYAKWIIIIIIISLWIIILIKNVINKE